MSDLFADCWLMPPTCDERALCKDWQPNRLTLMLIQHIHALAGFDVVGFNECTVEVECMWVSGVNKCEEHIRTLQQWTFFFETTCEGIMLAHTCILLEKSET